MSFTIISLPRVGPDHLSVIPNVEPLNIFLSPPGEDYFPANFRSLLTKRFKCGKVPFHR